MLFLTGILVATGCVFLVAFYWNASWTDETAAPPRPFQHWLWQGFVLPVSGWLFMNAGFFESFPPIIPEAAGMRLTTWTGLSFYLAIAGSGLLFVATWWTVISLAWMTTASRHRDPDQGEFQGVFFVWSCLCLPLSIATYRLGGFLALGFTWIVWLAPAVHYISGLPPKKKPSPMYSRAVAKLKLGRYTEAELEVLGQLENFEEDYEGWMMLAELYAQQFNDLPEAEQTIRGLCEQPNLTALQISRAYQRLADWHLKLGRDPVAARRALEEICRKLPETHAAHMARLRMDQLPASRKEWLEQIEVKPIKLPALKTDLDDADGEGTAPIQPEPSAVELANELVAKLCQDPNQIGARERLARVLSEKLGKHATAIEQLELLIGMPQAEEKKKAEWLSWIAAWQLQHLHDQESGCKTLERLVHEYPQTPQAFAAQRRLNLIDMEKRFEAVRAKEASPPLP
jgi:tetratricopeptide (TPR) repeat protein